MRLTIALALSLLTACGSSGGKREVRIPKGAGGLGFLPLLVMEKYRLIEKYADVTVRWMDLGGPAAMNDAAPITATQVCVRGSATSCAQNTWRLRRLNVLVPGSALRKRVMFATVAALMRSMDSTQLKAICGVKTTFGRASNLSMSMSFSICFARSCTVPASSP